MLSFNDIVSIVDGKVLCQKSNPQLTYLLIDSRKIDIAHRSVFFAIQGEKHDGHKYLTELLLKNVKVFVVEKPIHLQGDDICVIQVKSSVQALQKIAAWHRAKFRYPVIGLTGSNGKTIIKEWIAQLLAQDFHVVKSPKSYNSQVGVPLSVWGMSHSNNLAVFEAGISLPNEMEHLQQVIQPTIGLFTNIGSAHEEGFEGIDQKVNEKLKLFTNVQTLVCCADQELVYNSVLAHFSQEKVFAWSLFNSKAKLWVKDITKTDHQTQLTLVHDEEVFQLSLAFTDHASIENALHTISVAIVLGVRPHSIAERLAYLTPVKMRLELKKAINDCYIIDDSYNNDLAGLKIALNFLNQQKHTSSRTVILSDLLQTSEQPSQLYAEVASLLEAQSVKKFIGIGKELLNHKKYFNNAIFFASTEEFLNQTKPEDFNHELILVKGARTFGFEKIVEHLQQKLHGTILEVNLDALVHNLNYYKSLLKPDTKIMVMVKALAYGNGSFEISDLLQFHRVDYLGVAYADEGVALRLHGIHLPIMVMNPEKETFSKVFAHNLEPEIYSFNILQAFVQYHHLHNLAVPAIHLKIDTGMHRLGFLASEIDELLVVLEKNKQLRVASIFSHLAAADDASHHEFSLQQYQTFLSASSKIEAALGYKVIKHILNSAGIVRYPAWQLDMVRLGIGIYGIESSSTAQQNLVNVGRLTSRVSQIKSLASGLTVGYSRKGMLDKPSKIATISIGYADGFDRRFGNGVGKVWVNGILCPIIGNVCMDMAMVDVSNAHVAEGDEVEIFGNHISIIQMAQSIGTIPYEILTNVSGRVKRIFYSE